MTAPLAPPTLRPGGYDRRMDQVGREDHPYFEGLALAHVLGGLSESDGQVFRAHLLECSDCRARVGELRALAHDLADVERDERRVRAARAIETKRREVDEDAGEEIEPVPSARSSRIVVFVGLALVVLLAAWNFTLRGANEALTMFTQKQGDAVEVALFGIPWDVQVTGGGATVEASVKEQDGRLAVLMSGVESGDVYGLYLIGADDQVLGNHPLARVDDRLFDIVALPKGAVRAVVTDRPGAGVVGTRVIEAARPPTA